MFKKIHRELKKESCRKIGNGFLVMALICCLMFVSYQATSAVITSAKVGDRELPIYCVDTTEKKVALSFDAAWGAEDFPRIMDVLDKHKVKVTFFMTGGWVEDNPDCVKELVKMFPNAKFIYLMRNPYTVFESTRSFFTNTIQPLKLQDISNEELQENILSVYAKLYHKYEADKKFIPEGNLVEVRFEDYETNAFDMTQEIYQKLQIPGFEDARADIEAYVNKKKGYKKNKYQYKPETVELVEKNWSFALEQWGYKL